MSLGDVLCPKEKAKFWKLKPSLIGFAGGHAFYEDPWEGDESTLMAENLGSGEIHYTDFWELPEDDEVTEGEYS